MNGSPAPDANLSLASTAGSAAAANHAIVSAHVPPPLSALSLPSSDHFCLEVIQHPLFTHFQSLHKKEPEWKESLARAGIPINSKGPAPPTASPVTDSKYAVTIRDDKVDLMVLFYC
jgi:hypothetical protein